jgi:uncharacterized protein involved in exopolysaccharide biosynthesis
MNVDFVRSAQPHKGLGLTFALRLLWTRRRFLLRATGTGFMLAAIVAFLIPKTYKATARLMPPDNQNNSALAMLAAVGGGGTMGGLAGDLLGMKSTGDLFIGVLRSSTVEDRLVDKFDLRKVYHTSFYDSARATLESNTQISEDRKSGIISIDVFDRDPKRAAAIAQAYVEELNGAISDLSTSSARRERIFLEERLKAVKQDLDNASEDLGRFSSKHATLDVQQQGRAMLEGAANVQGQLIAAESELQGLRQMYSDNNVRVRALQARIADLKQSMQKIGGAPVSDTKPDKAGADADGIPSIRRLPVLGVQWSDLYRRTRIQEAVFETLSKQYELAKVQEAKEIPTVKVLDPPKVPERKFGPPRLVIGVLGTLISFLLSVSWCFLQFRWSTLPENDERKVFANEVAGAVHQRIRSLAIVGIRRDQDRNSRMHQPVTVASEDDAEI